MRKEEEQEIIRREAVETGLRIQDMRKKRGLSQGAAARGIDVTRQTITNWENGAHMPNVMQLKRIASFFNCTTEYILYGSKEKHKLEEKKLQLQKAEELLRYYEHRKNKREKIKDRLFTIFFPITPLIVFVFGNVIYHWIFSLIFKMEDVFDIELSVITKPMNIFSGTSGLIFFIIGFWVCIIAGIIFAVEIAKNKKEKKNEKDD